MITGIRFLLLFWLLFLICLRVLAFSLKRNKFRLLNGILGNLSLFFLGLAVAYSQVEWLDTCYW